MKIITSLFLLVMAGTVLAQSTEPVYRFEFRPGSAADAAGVQSGRLQVHALPPGREVQTGDSGEPAELTLSAAARLYRGSWLTEVEDETGLAEAELFVLAKFRLFRTADDAEEFKPWLDGETFAAFSQSVARGDIDLAADRLIYRQYDSIRLLGAIRYGYYTLLYTQFRSGQDGELLTSVMPVRRVGGRLVSAGALHARSHELYRMLSLGTLQRSLFDYLEAGIDDSR